MSSQKFTNFRVRQKLDGDKASVSLRVQDPFNTGKFRVQAGDVDADADHRAQLRQPRRVPDLPIQLRSTAARPAAAAAGPAATGRWVRGVRWRAVVGGEWWVVSEGNGLGMLRRSGAGLHPLGSTVLGLMLSRGVRSRASPAAARPGCRRLRRAAIRRRLRGRPRPSRVTPRSLHADAPPTRLRSRHVREPEQVDAGRTAPPLGVARSDGVWGGHSRGDNRQCPRA